MGSEGQQWWPQYAVGDLCIRGLRKENFMAAVRISPLHLSSDDC